MIEAPRADRKRGNTIGFYVIEHQQKSIHWLQELKEYDDDVQHNYFCGRQ